MQTEHHMARMDHHISEEQQPGPVLDVASGSSAVAGEGGGGIPSGPGPDQAPTSRRQPHPEA